VGEAIDALLADGALDAWTVPIGMKKNRPGVCLSLLCETDRRDALARRLIELTGSFGVRYRSWSRLVLDRRHETVSTAYGEVRLKVGRLDGRDLVRKVEFDDARRAAEATGVSVRTVIDAAKASAEPGASGDAAEGGGP
jgi:hypothetical protein